MTVLRSALLPVICVLLAATGLVGGPASAQRPVVTPPRVVCPTNPVNLAVSNRLLVNCNFNGWNLAGADFRNSTLQNAVFIGADLTGAKFDGATLQSQAGDLALVTDFTLAKLDHTSFTGATFSGPVYFTYATLDCADFSKTDIRANAIFGPSLNLGKATDCRTKFQATTMSCEFIGQWNKLDLTGAILGACSSQLATPNDATTGHDFSGGIYRNVNFDGLDLARSNWTKAVVTGASFQGSTLDGATGLAGSDLTQAIFTQASLKGVDLSSAKLYGTVFDHANLDKAKLQGAYLSPCPPPGTCVAASLRGAWLRNADLSGSHLENAVFNSASFYGTIGAGSKSCVTASGTCASAHGATLTSTDFTDAYLFGVDFSGAQMHGAKFDGAVLVAANFAGATVAPEPNQVNGSFANAFLQGANLGTAVLDGVTFAGAFFDFNASGNTLVIQLNSNHTRFAGWATKDQPVCTRVTYGASASVPSNQTGLTCPDNTKASPVNGCGPASPGIPPTSHWNNGNSIARNDPAASYRSAATFTAASTDLCRRNLAW